MSTRNTSAASSHRASDPREQPASLNFLTDLGRRQLALATESLSVLCSGSEALRGIQRDAARETSAFHAGLNRKLLEPCQPADLMAIQSEWLRFVLQGAGKYWQQLGAQMMQTQVDMMRSASHVPDSEMGSLVQSPLANHLFMLDPLAWTGKHGAEENAVTHH